MGAIQEVGLPGTVLWEHDVRQVADRPAHATTELILKDTPVYDQYFYVLYFGMIPVTMLIFLLNVPVILSILFNKPLHIPTFYFIVSLAMADLCVGMTCLGKLLAPREASHDLCLLRIGAMLSPVCASMLFMFWIAVDRLLAISNALTYIQKMTSFRAIIAIFATWIYALIIGFMPLMGWKHEGSHAKYCSFMYVVDSGYIWFAFTGAFLLPVCANIIIYIKIFKVARRHIRKITSLESSVRAQFEHKNSLRILSRASFLRTFKAVKTLGVVTGCFLLTWGPFIFTTIVQNLCDSCRLKDVVGTYLLLLGICNSFLNPLIYGFWNRDFRKILKKTCSTCEKATYIEAMERPNTSIALSEHNVMQT